MFGITEAQAAPHPDWNPKDTGAGKGVVSRCFVPSYNHDAEYLRIFKHTKPKKGFHKVYGKTK